jgi:hypothetical protein
MSPHRVVNRQAYVLRGAGLQHHPIFRQPGEAGVPTSRPRVKSRLLLLLSRSERENERSLTLQKPWQLESTPHGAYLGRPGHARDQSVISRGRFLHSTKEELPAVLNSSAQPAKAAMVAAVCRRLTPPYPAEQRDARPVAGVNLLIWELVMKPELHRVTTLTFVSIGALCLLATPLAIDRNTLAIDAVQAVANDLSEAANSVGDSVGDAADSVSDSVGNAAE